MISLKSIEVQKCPLSFKINRLVENFVRDKTWIKRIGSKEGRGRIVFYNYYYSNVSSFFFFLSPFSLSFSLLKEEKAGYKVNSIRGLLTASTN